MGIGTIRIGGVMDAISRQHQHVIGKSFVFFPEHALVASMGVCVCACENKQIGWIRWI